jgi:hypothetical protein
VRRGLQPAIRGALHDLDIVPIGEALRDGAIGGLVRQPEGIERRVAEHHAEAEGVVGAVALHHRHLRLGPVALHQDGEVEPRRPAADHRDAHGRTPFPGPD